MKDDREPVLAPCGLDCGGCIAYDSGAIKQHSKALRSLLGDFESYAERLSGVIPALKEYPEFSRVLAFLSSVRCPGCRVGGGANPSCVPARCEKIATVEFCGFCDDFPCTDHGLDPELAKRWLRLGQRLREIGIDAFTEEVRRSARYS